MPTSVEDQALDALTSSFLTDCLDVAQQLKKWRSDYERAKPKTGDDSDAGADGTPLAQWVQTVDAYLQKRSPEFVAFLQLKDKVAKVKASFTDDQKAAYTRQLAQLYAGEIFSVLDSLSQTGQNAKKGLATLVANKVFERPYTFEGGVTLQVKGFDATSFTGSPFSKSHGLTIDLVYLQGQPGEMRAEASGLYFKPDGTPVLDRVQLKVDTKALLTQALGQGLIKAIAQTDLPLADSNPINNVSWTDFKQGQGSSAGAFKFDLSLKLGQALDFLPNLQVKNVVLRCDGKIDLGKDGVIACGPFADPIPVGPTPFAFTNHKISYAPSKRTGTLETDLVPTGPQAASGENPVRFHLTIALDLPLTEVKVNGTAFVADQDIGTVEGRITKTAIDVNLTVPDKDSSTPALERLLKGKVSLHLDREGLSGDGSFLFLEGLKATTQMVLKFNGNGSFAVTESGQIGPLTANVSVNGGFSPGFKRVTLNGALTLELDLDLMSVVASVDIDAASDRNPAVIATARALGVSAEMRLPSLAKLDRDALKQALNTQGGQLVANASKLFAGYEAQGRTLGAKFDQGLRDSVSDFAAKNGIASVHTGNKTVDIWLGQAAQAGKDAGGAISDLAKGAEDAVGSEAKKGEDAVAQVDPTKLLRDAKLSGLSLTDGGASQAIGRITKQARAQQVELRLAAVVNEMNRLGIFRSSVPSAGKNKVAQDGGKVSELRIRVRNCVAAHEGDADAALGFAIQVSGFTHAVNPRQKQSRPDVRSGVYRGVVQIKGLFGKGKPTAQVEIPKLDHGSEWPAEDLLHEEITSLLERLLPQAQEEGRFQERKLAIQNLTDERVTVWVQTETHPAQGATDRWVWEPGEPGQIKKAFRFTLEPKKTFLLIRSDRREAVRGMAARIWAESESGRTWTRHQTETVWLVDEFEGNEGRHYYAPFMETFVYRLEASNNPTLFHTRGVTVTNHTNRPVVVNARAQSFDLADGAVWADARLMMVQPGTTVTLERADGSKLHGVKVQLWAEDDEGRHFRWEKHKTDPVLQVPPEGYRAPKIGFFEYTLEPPKRSAGQEQRTATTLRLPADDVWVGDVNGKRVRDAQDELTRSGLKVNLDKGVTPTAQVTHQEPVSAWRRVGAEVRLNTTPSRPPTDPKANPVVVPDVVRKNLTEARKQLTGAKLTVTVANNPEHGSVKTQSPDAGKKVQPGTPVVLTFVHLGDRADAAAKKRAGEVEAKKRAEEAAAKKRAEEEAKGVKEAIAKQRADEAARSK